MAKRRSKNVFKKKDIGGEDIFHKMLITILFLITLDIEGEQQKEAVFLTAMILLMLAGTLSTKQLKI